MIITVDDDDDDDDTRFNAVMLTSTWIMVNGGRKSSGLWGEASV